MKCKYCGQDLTVDNETKIGVCVGCGRKFVVSKVAKAKVCKACDTPLVNKDAFWECPNCGKKFVFSKKNQDTDAKPNVVKTENSEQFSFADFDLDIDIGTENQTFDNQETNYQALETHLADSQSLGNQDVENHVLENQALGNSTQVQEDYIIPLNDFLDDDLSDDSLIPDGDTLESNDISISNDEFDLNEEEVSDEEIEDGELFKDFENDKNIFEEPLQENQTLLVENDNANLQDEFVDAESLADTPEVQLYSLVEEEENPFQADNTNVNSLGSLQAMTKSKKQSSSIVSGIVFKILGIILGILTLASGVLRYLFTEGGFIENISKGNLDGFIQIVANYGSYVFFALFALTLLLATLKKIGIKRIGTIICLLSPILIILTILLESKLSERNIYTYAIYAGYAILLFGSFLTMVISSKSELAKTATKMGIVLFVFSLVSLLVVALQMIPLKALKLDFLSDYIKYFVNLDKLLLGFASISTVVLLCKSE